MANNPKKINDPTEAALSAIQDALSLREETPTSESKEASAPTVDGAAADHLASEPPWRKGRASSPVNEEFDAEARTPIEFAADTSTSDEPDLPRRPANDDRESIGQILRALQRRPHLDAVDVVRRERVARDKEDANAALGEGFGDLRLPVVPAHQLAVVPKLERAGEFGRAQMAAHIVEPVFVLMAIADENLRHRDSP